MRKDEFRSGEEWAYRREQQLGTPASRVQLVAMPNRKGLAKVKIRFMDGELKGLEEFVLGTHLRCRWKEWRHVERDEKKLIDFLNQMDHRPEVDPVVAKAATEVLLATGEDLMLDDYRNYTKIWSSQVPALPRVAERCGISDEPWSKRPAIVDREGHMYVPNEVLIDLALAFAKAEPESVHLWLDHQARELLEGYGPRDHQRHARMIQSMPSHALARHWTGGMREHKYMRDRIRELELLLEYTITALEACGARQKASHARQRLEAGYNRSLALQLGLE